MSPIHFDPFRPIGPSGPGNAGPASGDRSGTSPATETVVFRGRSVTLLNPTADDPRIRPHLDVLKAVKACLSYASSAGPKRAQSEKPLHQRTVVTLSDADLPAPQRCGLETVAMRLAFSATRNGPLFQATMRQMGLDPNLLTDAQRSRLDRLVADGAHPLVGSHPWITKEVLGDAVTAALRTMSLPEAESAREIARYVAERAVSRAVAALAGRAPSECGALIADAMIRRMSNEGGELDRRSDRFPDMVRKFIESVTTEPLAGGRMAAVVAAAEAYITQNQHLIDRQ